MAQLSGHRVGAAANVIDSLGVPIDLRRAVDEHGNSLDVDLGWVPILRAFGSISVK